MHWLHEPFTIIYRQVSIYGSLPSPEPEHGKPPSLTYGFRTNLTASAATYPLVPLLRMVTLPEVPAVKV